MIRPIADEISNAIGKSRLLPVISQLRSDLTRLLHQAQALACLSCVILLFKLSRPRSNESHSIRIFIPF